jgi:hypothetical protein
MTPQRGDAPLLRAELPSFQALREARRMRSVRRSRHALTHRRTRAVSIPQALGASRCHVNVDALVTTVAERGRALAVVWADTDGAVRCAKRRMRHMPCAAALTRAPAAHGRGGVRRSAGTAWCSGAAVRLERAPRRPSARSARYRRGAPSAYRLPLAMPRHSRASRPQGWRGEGGCTATVLACGSGVAALPAAAAALLPPHCRGEDLLLLPLAGAFVATVHAAAAEERAAGDDLPDVYPTPLVQARSLFKHAS